MNCTACGTAGAYQGFSKLECVNRDCKYFSEAWARDSEKPAHWGEDVDVQPPTYPVPIDGQEFSDGFRDLYCWGGKVYWVTGTNHLISSLPPSDFHKYVADGLLKPTGKSWSFTNGVPVSFVTGTAAPSSHTLTPANALTKPKKIYDNFYHSTWWLEGNEWVEQRNSDGSIHRYPKSTGWASVDEAVSKTPGRYSYVD